MTRNEEEIQEEVDGLAMDMEMTREQLIEKFGARQTIKMPGDEDEDELQGSVSVLRLEMSMSPFDISKDFESFRNIFRPFLTF